MTFSPALEQLYLALAVVLFVAFVAGILGNRSATSRRKAGL